MCTCTVDVLWIMNSIISRLDCENGLDCNEGLD